jgi:ABC-type multidrug transport system ATPase subunit
MLGLAEVADTVVGDEHVRGISGGQAKRLSIGVEVVGFPDLIFLDGSSYILIISILINSYISLIF